MGKMRRLVSVSIATIALLAAIAGWGAATAAAASSFSLGKWWEPGSSADGGRLETRPAAQAFGSAMAAIGYANTTDLNGATATEGWLSAANSQVFGLFGHANERLAVLQDPAPGTDVYTTGHIHTATTSLYMPGAPDHERAWWPEFQPELVEDLKVAVFGGCHTALSDYWQQSMRLLGVDSYVGFRDLIYYPAASGGTTSGSYFWKRFSVYAQAGYMVRDALSLARADLFAVEGNNWGYDSWLVDGAAEDPGAVRFTPASGGQLNGFGWNFISQPSVATQNLQLASLTTTRSHGMSVNGSDYVDRETAEGASYRLDEQGELVNWTAPTSSKGSESVSTADAVAAAARFAERHVSWFDAAAMGAESTASAAHSRGESLLAVEWRETSTDGTAGPAVVRAEVDLRTGNVAGFTAQRAARDPAAFDVTREQAIAVARAASGAGDATIEAVERDRWHGPRWTVRINRGENALGTALKSIVIIDARTGEVMMSGVTG